MNKACKLLVAMLVVSMLFSIVPQNVSASTSNNYVVVVNVLNVRAGAGTNFRILTTVSMGRHLTVSRYNGTWAYVGGGGWVHRNYIVRITAASGTRTVNVGAGSTLNVRSAPTTASLAIGSLPNGARVTITGRVSGWYRISHGINSHAWVSAAWVR
ncbi:MAG: SH3 domain-containing protein [Firmicutes bacterium]|nr:SH3 domain-containing protein [Bacillota bacterium]